MKKADLHIHSTCSDGELSVDEILKKAKEMGLSFVGIIDHDTLAQFEKVAESPVAKECEKSGIKVWVGTEFSSKMGDLSMHLLGYNFDSKNKKILELIDEVVRLRKLKCEEKIQLLKERGIELKREQIDKLMSMSNPGKPHIAAAMQENGIEGTIGEIIRKYLNVKSKKVYKVEAKEVIETIKAAGGIAVAAHPYQIQTENHLTEEETQKVWEELVKLGIDGFECYYSLYDKEQIKVLTDFAKAHNLLVTMGSDYHGPKVKQHIAFGQICKYSNSR